MKIGTTTLKAANQVLRVSHGLFWVTRKGDNEDYLVEPGNSLVMEGTGWVVQGLEPGSQAEIAALCQTAGSGSTRVNAVPLVSRG